MRLQIGEYNIGVTRKKILYNVHAPWDKKNYVNAYRIMIDYNGESMTTTFYDSMMKHSYCDVRFTKQDATEFLENTISDAMGSRCSFDIFCSEYGYDMYDDSKEAKRVYAGCCKLYDGLSRMFSDYDMVDIVNAINYGEM